jgi:hypothetical protein
MKKKRLISLIVVACLLIGGVNLYVFDGFGAIRAAISKDKGDRKTAEDISALTGRSASSLLRLKADSGGWNAALKTLAKGGADEKTTAEELAELLNGESFTDDEIKAAKAAALQVAFHLDEISRNGDSLAPGRTAGFGEDESESEKYEKLGDAFDQNLAVYLSLKLKEKFGSIDAALDEYLYSLQIGVDLSLCVADEQEYEKQVLEKAAELSREDALTAAKIADYALTSAQTAKQSASPSPGAAGENAPETAPELPDPKAAAASAAPNLTVENPKPQDPTQAVMDEIDAINKSWMNTGR